MQGRAFLEIARELVQGATEAHWRAATGRAYYALMLEARDTLQRWGFRVPRGDGVHAFVRLRLVYAADTDLKQVGHALEVAGTFRNQADYQLAAPGPFADARTARGTIRSTEAMLPLLDQIDADLPRRAAAIADIRARWP